MTDAAQIREALRITDYQSDVWTVVAIREAAEAHADLLEQTEAGRAVIVRKEECGDCYGDGIDAIATQQASAGDDYPSTVVACPSCVDGWVWGDSDLAAIADAIEVHLPEEVQPYGLRLAKTALNALAEKEWRT